jgi:hypothetical protein
MIMMLLLTGKSSVPTILIPHSIWGFVLIPDEALENPDYSLYNVTRDNPDTTEDNWFELCELGELGSTNVPYIGLLIHDYVEKLTVKLSLTTIFLMALQLLILLLVRCTMMDMDSGSCHF